MSDTNKNYYALLMAGGVGSRFWPVSTTEYPKQFHDMLGTGETLLQKTFGRLAKIVPTDNILVLTNTRYNDLVQQQLPTIQPKNIVLEPVMRNTAPCILLSALKVQKENPNAIMIVAPSDAWIEDEDAFVNDLRLAFKASAAEDILTTIGIRPTFPNTGYGYIEYEKSDLLVKDVTAFKEKPTYELAKEFVANGNYLWNAGMFIWSVSSVLKAFEQFLPSMYSLFKEGVPEYNEDNEYDFINTHYDKAENISIDYGIMEKSANVKVIPASFDWNDLGTWGSLYEKLDKDADANALVNSKIISYNASGNVIHNHRSKVVVVDGLQDYIIVNSKEALVIVPKQKEQDIKQIRNDVLNKFGK